MIEYTSGVCPDPAVISELYRVAPLIRPLGDLGRIETMFAGSNVIHAAWEDGALVGLLRGWTDGAHDGFICDLAIHPDYQRGGMGRELLRQAREGRPQVQFILRASRMATDYYAHLGWQKIENGWFWPRQS